MRFLERFIMPTYIPIRTSGQKLETKLRRTSQLYNPSERAIIRWFDRTRASCMGVSFQVLRDAEYLPAHPVFPACTDIDVLESNLLNEGSSNLFSFARQTPIVLHRMGYFSSYGVRELYLVSMGGIRCIDFLDPKKPSKIIRFTIPQNEPHPIMHLLKKLVDRMLTETPDAYLFAHCLGSEIDLDLINKFTPQLLASYAPVRDYSLYGISIPSKQEANLGALLVFEENELKMFADRYRLLFFYGKEFDKSLYCLFANGEKLGFNNQRAMRGMIERARQENPLADFLVHRMGSPLDFNLVERLRFIDISKGMIERPSREEV